MVKHIVMFKLKDEFSVEEKASNVKQLKQKLEALPSKIQGIKFFEAGINFTVSPAAYDLVLVSEFTDLEALKAYAIHPAHLEVVDFVNKVTSNRVVADYNI